MKALLVHPAGMVEEVIFPKEDKLEWYYQQLSCDCIDIVRPYGLEAVANMYDLKSLLGKFSLVVDDESLLKPKPEVNPIASILYGCDDHGQPLFGKVLIVKDEETEDGIESVGLDDSELALMRASINSLVEMHNEKVREAYG